MKSFDFSESESCIAFFFWRREYIYSRDYICFGRYSHSSYYVLGETLCN